MVYVGGMPEVNTATRLARMPALETAAIRIRPSEASRLAGFGDHPERLVLTTVLGRPAFRIGVAPVTIFADTGERLDGIGESEAVAVARRFLDKSDHRLPLRAVRDRAGSMDAYAATVSAIS